MKRFLAALFFLLFVVPASAQTCPTRPSGDNTNACASTAFVHAATGGTVPITVPNGGTGQTSFTTNLPLIGNGTGALGQGTRSGNTTDFATTTGTLTNGHCITIDTSGNLIDAGFACNTGSGSGTVSSASLNQLAVYTTNPTGTVVGGTFLPNFPASGQWYQNSGAYVTRLNDRLLIGAATVSDANLPNVTQDWLTQFQNSVSISPLPRQGNLTVLNTAGLGLNDATIVAGVHSNGMPACTSGCADMEGITSIALADSSISNNNIWAFYGESHCLGGASLAEKCAGMEIDLTVQFAGVPNPLNPFTDPQIVGIQSGCGAGESPVGQFICGAAFVVAANPIQWISGIYIQNGSVGTDVNNQINAIEMPILNEITWYKSGTSTPVADVYGDTNGSFNINVAGTIVTNGQSGISCGPGTVSSSFTVRNGIVTHC